MDANQIKAVGREIHVEVSELITIHEKSEDGTFSSGDIGTAILIPKALWQRRRRSNLKNTYFRSFRSVIASKHSKQLL